MNASKRDSNCHVVWATLWPFRREMKYGHRDGCGHEKGSERIIYSQLSLIGGRWKIHVPFNHWNYHQAGHYVWCVICRRFYSVLNHAVD